MPAPKVEQPVIQEDKKEPNGVLVTEGKAKGTIIPFTDGPVRGKNDSFLPAAYQIAPGIIRIDR